MRSAKTYDVGGVGQTCDLFSIQFDIHFRLLTGLKEFQILLARKERIASAHLIIRCAKN